MANVVENDIVCKLPYTLFLFVAFVIGPMLVVYVYVSIVDPAVDRYSFDSWMLIISWALLLIFQMVNFWLGWKALHYAKSIIFSDNIIVRYYMYPALRFTYKQWDELMIRGTLLPSFSCGKREGSGSQMNVIICGGKKIIVSNDMASRVRNNKKVRKE